MTKYYARSDRCKCTHYALITRGWKENEVNHAKSCPRAKDWNKKWISGYRQKSKSTYPESLIRALNAKDIIVNLEEKQTLEERVTQLENQVVDLFSQIIKKDTEDIFDKRIKGGDNNGRTNKESK